VNLTGEIEHQADESVSCVLVLDVQIEAEFDPFAQDQSGVLHCALCIRWKAADKVFEYGLEVLQIRRHLVLHLFELLGELVWTFLCKLKKQSDKQELLEVDAVVNFESLVDFLYSFRFFLQFLQELRGAVGLHRYLAHDQFSILRKEEFAVAILQKGLDLFLCGWVALGVLLFDPIQIGLFLHSYGHEGRLNQDLGKIIEILVFERIPDVYLFHDVAEIKRASLNLQDALGIAVLLVLLLRHLRNHGALLGIRHKELLLLLLLKDLV
jgi:hypothetical protein